MHTQDIIKNLRQSGYRLTPQRLLILQLLEEHGGHLSPLEIFEIAKSRMPGVTEATVYRSLDFLTRHGLALVAHIGSGKLVYESTAHDHHHLICRDCGYTVEIEHDLLTALYTTFKEKTGFLIDCSHVTFFGYCPDCEAGHDHH